MKTITTDENGRLPRYKDNLRVEGTKVYSYVTHVANIHMDKEEVVQLGTWSSTTQKHINYVAEYFGLCVRLR